MNWMARRCRHISRADRPVMSKPARRMTPAVGLISLTIMRAAVDLPQPDSPTMPSVSPARTAKEMPSTANTEPNRRPKMPRRTGKCLTRPSTSRTIAGSGMRVLLSALRMPAGREMAGHLLLQRWRGVTALLGGKRAAWSERTAHGARTEDRQHTGNFGEARLPLLTAPVDPRHGAQQAHRIGMTWVAEQSGNRRLLHL